MAGSLKFIRAHRCDPWLKISPCLGALQKHSYRCAAPCVSLDLARLPFLGDPLSSREPTMQRPYAGHGAHEKTRIVNPAETRVVGHCRLRVQQPHSRPNCPMRCRCRTLKPNFMFAPITRIILYVKNLDKTAEFYQRVFELEVVSAPEKAGSSPGAGGCNLAVHQAAKTADFRRAAAKIIFGVRRWPRPNLFWKAAD